VSRYADDNLTTEMVAEWNAWLADGRPPIVRAIADRLPPWRWYRLTTTGQACRVQAIAEDGTVRIYAEHPVLGPITGVSVYGVNPDELVPWNAAQEAS
jgi:hypothetical protein